MNPLTKDQIQELINYEHNKRLKLEPNVKPNFDKEDTISILNAVTEKQNRTADGKWDITYYPVANKPLRFFVCPAQYKEYPPLPCALLFVDAAIRRLAL